MNPYLGDVDGLPAWWQCIRLLFYDCKMKKKTIRLIMPGKLLQIFNGNSIYVQVDG